MNSEIAMTSKGNGAVQLFGRIEAQRRIRMAAFRHDHQFRPAGARRIDDALGRQHLAVFASGQDAEVGGLESFAADRPVETELVEDARGGGERLPIEQQVRHAW